MSTVDLIYFYGFSAVYLIVSVPYIVIPAGRVLDGKRPTFKGVRRILWGMALIALSFNYFAYAHSNGLHFPLQLFQIASVSMPERLYQIWSSSFEIASVIFLLEAILGKTHKVESFGLAVQSSFLYVVIRIIGSTV